MSMIALNKLCKKGTSSLRQKDVANDGPYPVYGASGIVGYSASYQNEDRYVAVIKDGAGVGRVCECKPKSSVLGTMQALLPAEGVECDYLLHLVKGMRLGDGFTGSTIPHIYFKDYGKRLLVEHDRGEQRQIARSLNAVETQTQALKTQSDNLDKLVKSRFVEVLSRCDMSSLVPLQSCTRRVKVGFVGTVGKHYTDASGVPMVRTTNITSSGLDLSELKYVTDEFDAKNAKSHLRSGDVIIARHGENGRACVYEGPDAQCLNVVIIEPMQDMLNSICLENLMNSILVREQIASKLVGSTQKVVNTKTVAAVLVPIIPLALQQEFAAFVQQVDKLKFETQQAIDKLQMLYDSLAQEYFTVA